MGAFHHRRIWQVGLAVVAAIAVLALAYSTGQDRPGAHADVIDECEPKPIVDVGPMDHIPVDCTEIIDDPFAPIVSPKPPQSWCDWGPFSNLRIVEFGDGRIDALLLFDMSLHQSEWGVQPEVTVANGAAATVTYTDGSTSTTTLTATDGRREIVMDLYALWCDDGRHCSKLRITQFDDGLDGAVLCST